MKEHILQTLHHLRSYALKRGYEVVIDYHEEESALMRFANSAISLNTSEHLIRLNITAYRQRQRASYEMITDLDQLDAMQRGIDQAAEMAAHAQPLTYQPTIPTFSETFSDESHFDPGLATLANEEKLAYFNTVAAGLESPEIKLAGVFSNGATTLARITTPSEHTLYSRFSDAQVTAVLSHEKLKWEVRADQSAHAKAALDPEPVRRELSFLLARYQREAPQSLPLGTYDIVFGAAATANLLLMMNWIGFNGGSMKRGFSMLGEDKIGQKVFSEKITLADDPSYAETFPFQRDATGIKRERFPLFEHGVFRAFTWYQDDADEFGAKPTGHTVWHNSLVLQGGDMDVPDLDALVSLPRDNDLLYIPFLHYMNIVNPSRGVITASSRFGALYLKKDGSLAVPYNVRLTQSLSDIFGEKVAWLSKQTVPYNVSSSYGARNPTAIIVPRFMRVNSLEISHSNTSY
jgi:predicted Zn-dependent protease